MRGGWEQQVRGLHKTPEKWLNLVWAVNCVDICALHSVEMGTGQCGCISLSGCIADRAQKPQSRGARRHQRASERKRLRIGTWHSFRVSVSIIWLLNCRGCFLPCCRKRRRELSVFWGKVKRSESIRTVMQTFKCLLWHSGKCSPQSWARVFPRPHRTPPLAELIDQITNLCFFHSN